MPKYAASRKRSTRSTSLEVKRTELISLMEEIDTMRESFARDWKDLDFLKTHERDRLLAEKIRRANLIRGEISRAEKKLREKEMR